MDRARIREQYEQYPSLCARDLFKFLFQSALGCEHLLSDRETALSYIRRESTRVSPDALPRTDRLAGQYSRVHLSWLNGGLTPETLSKLFFASAVKEQGGIDRLEALLAVARDMIRRGELPLDPILFEEELTSWRGAGFPAIHHSDTYREAYAPAYRVISNRYANFIPLLAKLDSLLSRGSVILALEGGSASGKTTLASVLREVYACRVIHMDDFFLRPEQRTAERLSEVGGNLDRERFAAEVLPSLIRGEDITYRPFDCSTRSLLPPVTVEATRLTVVEGAYSLHPAFGGYCDLSVYLDISPDRQRERICRRNSPPMAERFFSEWIPLETRYFEKTAVRDRVDLVIRVWED